MNKMKSVVIVVFFLASFLTACMKPTSEQYNDNVKNMRDVLQNTDRNKQKISQSAAKLNLPSSISTQMMPSSAALPGSTDKASVLRFDVSVNQVSANEFFSGLSQGSKTSIIVSPGVTGQISLQLNQVTLTDVLKAVSDLYGYRYEKTTYGYTIYPKELQTRMFILDKLTLQRTLQTNTQVNGSSGDLTQASSGSSSGGGSSSATQSTVTIQASQKDSFWSDMQNTISALIGGDGNTTNTDSPMVQVTASTGVIVVRAYPDAMKLVEQYLQRTQSILGREVIIEAIILDVTLLDEYSTGINWNILTSGGTVSQPSSTTSTGSLLNSVYTLSMTGDRNNFAYALKLLSTQGRISVLSKPRVSTINNQSAVIKVGSDNYYVTNVQSQITTNGTSSSSNTTTSTINLQAFFSGIALYVTPQITSEGEVNLHIHPSISKVSENTLDVEVDGQANSLPVAQSQIRETDTVVHAKDGQVIILGGLIQTTMSDTTSGLPIDPKYQDTVGKLTTSNENTGIRSELVILLRPLIVQDGVWQAELKKTAETAYTPLRTDSKKAEV